MGNQDTATLVSKGLDLRDAIYESSDEEFTTADEYSRRSELFVGQNKESFVDYCVPVRCEGVGDHEEPPLPPYGTVKYPQEKFTPPKKEDISDGIAHSRLRSSAELEELGRIQRGSVWPYPHTKELNARAEAQNGSDIECFFIRQQNSNSRLSITQSLFESLRKERSIFGRIREHAMSFGFKVREDDVGPPRCRFRLRTALENRPNRFEVVYGLRYVERSGSKNPLDEWRVRQSAMYQSFKWFAQDSSSETWLFISASQSMESLVYKYMRKIGNSRMKTPFDLHLSLIRVALSNWRWYIKSLVKRTTEQTSRIVAATVVVESNVSSIDFRINFEDQQILKVVEDRVLDLGIIWDSTIDTINELLQRWQNVKLRMDYQFDPDHITSGLQDCVHEVQLYQGKTKILLRRIQGTATLLSNLLEHENGKQMQFNGQSLKVLAQETRIENITMRRLTEKATKDAAAVKAITVITILYLPTTVVAGFFSTQFVFQADGNAGRPKLAIAENWWVYVAVSVPLTFVTITIWYAWITYPWKSRWTRRLYIRHSDTRRVQEEELATQNNWNETASGIDSSEIMRCNVRMRNESQQWPMDSFLVVPRSNRHAAV